MQIKRKAAAGHAMTLLAGGVECDQSRRSSSLNGSVLKGGNASRIGPRISIAKPPGRLFESARPPEP